MNDRISLPGGPSVSQLWRQAGDLVASMQRPLVISHTRPDCDAYGSLIALRSILRALGRDPQILAFNPIPRTYSFLERFEFIPVWGRDAGSDALAGTDGVIITDTCSYSQLEPLAEWLTSTTAPKVAVDHHATRDVPVDAAVIDDGAAAACLLIHEWAKLMEWPVDDDAARALFLGIATDTGWFCHSNTDARAFAAVAELTARGIRPNEYHVMVLQSDTAARVRLLGEALHSLELFCQERLAVMTLDAATFQRIDARTSETENVINEPLRIRSVIVSVLLIEQPDGPVRVSFRSKAPIEGYVSADVDVSAIAARFGGGGHRRASGARIEGTLADVRRRVVERVSEELED
ncbi:MAG: bifunctional oligoribonuclease/PAP phosphatase NrnA [Phycisphaerales bacterium]|nr:MAG: bifunctional oligoribonuclease/PAP phosphatase NrnA [Phycisphaerales bacterium]